MRTLLLGLSIIGTLVSLPAIADDRIGYAQIRAGDYSAAERMIQAERRIYPNKPELLLNLAVVYNRTGREKEASTLYRRVLAQPEVMLDTATDSMSSYAVARAGLGQTDFASR
ncbi:tetratricopeptide repeat protein [uncultured Sphingomonas sp.]|uniref:tetratricopeptide repeat protein n=1 Tax=uncultured Sphingomonas sp. TaxID=158754 RepID=UPI0035CAFA06